MPALSPIWWHPSGQWTKKYRGRNYYFGTGSHEDALRRYLAEWDGIVAGGRPARAVEPGALTVAELCNRFLEAKRQRVQSGELTAEVWALYRRMAVRVLQALGRTRAVATLGPDDFGRVRAAAAAGLSPTTLTTFLKLARAMFAFGAELTDRPVRYGGQFALPAARTVRLHEEARPPKFLPADTLRRLADAAGPVLRAQILLGLNAAFGAMDLSELQARHLDDRPGWVVLHRRKTAVPRRCPLWPETSAALALARPLRPEPADPADADRVFLSHTGLPCRRYRERAEGAAGSRGDAIGAAWSKLCDAQGVSAPGSFYILRHVFRTVADELPDRPAVDAIMGHTDTSMAAAYRERLDDARLEAVVAHVREWLFGKKSNPDRRRK